MEANVCGSVTIYVQADAPADERRNNWLRTPKD